MKKNNNIYAVILAGGEGTRLWPLSRKKTPKHLISVFNTDSLILQTYKRILPIFALDNIYVVCQESHSSELKKQIPGLSEENIICEPCSRNTAPAIGLASILIAKKDPLAVTCILPADHFIEDEEKFRILLKYSMECAGENNRLLTFGIKPTYPSTGYGYIKVRSQESAKTSHQSPVTMLPEKQEILTSNLQPPTSSLWKGVRSQKSGGKNKEDIRSDCLEVERFIEKPKTEQAELFLKEDNYFWNSGIFVWRVDIILSCIKKYLSPVYNKLNEYISEGNNELKVNIYNEIEKISIDNGIMEKVTADSPVKKAEVGLIIGDFGWNDLGTLDEYLSTIFNSSGNRKNKQKDTDGNKAFGTIYNIDSTDNIIFSPKKKVAMIGIKNSIIVDTDDVLLILDKNHQQDIKKLVEELQKSGDYSYL